MVSIPGTNRRIFYAIEAVMIAPMGIGDFTTSPTYAANDYKWVVHGGQTVGINTRFILEQVFELGQISIYQNIETIPEIEVTIEKVLDGYTPLWCLATNPSPSPDLVGRSNTRCMVGMSIYTDTDQSASGTPITSVVCSGMYPQTIAYNCPVEGNSTESLTLIGNNKIWFNNGSNTQYNTNFGANGPFNNTNVPKSALGVSRRQHVEFIPSGSTYTILPGDLEGISSSGTNDRDAGGNFSAHVQSIRISANLGRTPLYELGRRAAYFRYTVFPVEIRSDISLISRAGDQVQALEEGINADGTNLTNWQLSLKLKEGLYVNCGNKNKLLSLTYGGADATGTRAGNATVTYTYQTFNDFTVGHPQDISNGGSANFAGTF